MKKVFSLILVLIMLLAAISLFVSCSTQEEHEKEYMLSFTDDLGREVVLEKKPERAAALIGSFADTWVLAGGTVCAAAQEAWDDFGLELKDAVNIGGAHSPNTELLLSSDPDIVIASASTSSNVEMLGLMENAGIPTAYFDVDNFNDYLEMLDICTDITGRKDLYKKNGTDIKEKTDGIKAGFANSGLSEKERTVLLLRASSGSVKAKGSEGTVLGEMLSDMGCINIADSDSSLLETLSIESIINSDPYRIFVVTMGDDTDKAMENLYRIMEENPAWGTLNAVKEGRLSIMDKKLFNLKPNSKWAEAYEKLSEILLG